MFTIDQKITEKDLKDKDLYKAFFSMNSHQVATPETSLEEARSFVLFFHEGKKRYSAFIGLYFLNTRRRLFYSHSSNPFLEDDIQTIEDESRNFAEDLGAMLDEVDFASLSDMEKKRWIDAQEIFAQTDATEVAREAPVIQPLPEPAPEPQAVPDLPLPDELPPVLEQPVAAAPEPEIPEPRPRHKEPDPQPVPAGKSGEGATSVAPTEAPMVQVEEEPRREKPTIPAQQTVAARKRQESTTKTIKSNPVKTSREAPRPDPAPNDVVSRDREALARLLTSF